MVSLNDDLSRRLDEIRDAGLFRELRRVDSPQSTRVEIGGKTFLNFSSNDYLGLANEPAIKKAAIEAIERYGAGAGASRLICGSLAPCHELEETLAEFKGTEAALTFSTGYTAALGAIGALLGKDDVIILDKLVHASIIDAARLCGAKLRVFDHNDLNDLETILKWAQSRSTQHAALTLIVTESVFSMDGDHAPLPDLVALKEKYGAWLMVDEAHATGLYGQHRRGLAEERGVSDRIDVQLGTLGKALGASGGYICGARALVDLLVNRARSFIFSTAPVPAAAAAASAGIRFVQSKAGDERRKALWQRVEQLNSTLNLQPLVAPKAGEGGSTLRSAIIPIVIGTETQAVAAAAELREQGIFVPAIRYPTVARGSARLRVTLSATHSADDVSKLVRALEQIINRKS